MKKNRASVHFATGRSESAYAAGVARVTTSSVEKTLAISEFSRNGVMLRSKTWAYWSRVGEKIQVGGLLAAASSCLKLVSTIQITGKTKTIPAIHATVPQMVLLNRDFIGQTSSLIGLDPEEAGDDPQREGRHDDRQDHHDHAGRRGLAVLELAEGGQID